MLAASSLFKEPYAPSPADQKKKKKNTHQLVKSRHYLNLANQTCQEPCAIINNLGYTAIGTKFMVLEINAAKSQTKD